MISTRGGQLESAVEIVAALRGADVTSVELVQRALERATAWQPAINAFSQVWEDEAMQAARRMDSMRAGERPALAGIPLAVKDVFDVRGCETTGCCAAYRGRIASTDAVTISSIREHGGVLIGKTNMHEISAGSTNLVSACGRAGNPWDPERMTGGSSGGSAAAVAAGIVPWALGSDTGGSVRIPASMCGTFALKPTTGRISIEGVLPHSPSLDCAGPIAGTAGDVWMLFLAMSGASRLPSLGAIEVDQARIGIPGGFFQTHVADEVLTVLQETIDVFEGAGARVEHVDGTGIDDSRRTWSRVAYPELAEAHVTLFDRPDEVDPSILGLLEYGRSLDPATRSAAGRRREEIAAWFRQRLKGFDALLVPTTPYPAMRASEYHVDVPVGESVPEDFVAPAWLTCAINLAGLPAINLPAGRSRDRLPIGVSLVGRDDEELTLCRLAAMWEEITGYRPPQPRLPAVGRATT